jgi:hypothetical protein
MHARTFFKLYAYMWGGLHTLPRVQQLIYGWAFVAVLFLICERKREMPPTAEDAAFAPIKLPFTTLELHIGGALIDLDAPPRILILRLQDV